MFHFYAVERFLLASGLDHDSVDALVAMIEKVLRVGDKTGKAAAANIVSLWLVDTESHFASFQVDRRSTQRFRGPAQSGRAYLAFESYLALCANKLRESQASRIGADAGAAPSILKRPADTGSHEPGPGGKGPKKAKVSAAAAGEDKDEPGSKADKVVVSVSGAYVLVGASYYDRSAIITALELKKSDYPRDLIHVALLKGKPKKARKLAFCVPGTVLPERVNRPPFPGFNADDYKLSGEPADF